MASLVKRIGRSPVTQAGLGTLLATYMRLVRATSAWQLEPPDLREQLAGMAPSIMTMWHGQHLLMPFAPQRGMLVKALISLHGDGEINAIAVTRLGIGTIRASGGHSAADIRRKQGARGFRDLVRTLDEGTTVALTADVPKGPAKIAGRGVVLLAKHSGRPIVPLAVATSRRIDVDSWDKAAVNLPFSRAAIVMGPPLYVPRDIDEAETEANRRTVTDMLNAVSARAYAIVDGGDAG